MGKNKLTDEIRKAVKSQLTAKPEPHRRVRTRKRIAGGGEKIRTKLKWPFHSESMGVNPEQCEAAEAAARHNGVPVEFDRETGAAIITGPEQYNKLAKSIGMKTGRDGFEIPGVQTGRRQQQEREKRQRIIDALENMRGDDQREMNRILSGQLE